jgi:uncharacterized zinc-type alcohol dehydrogenase-like protein
MTLIKAYAAAKAKDPLKPFQIERREPGPCDVVIDIHFCGICHSDVHQVRDEWGGSRFPMVPGHEIAGVVSAVGSSVKRYKVGDHVGVGCFTDSCRECQPCKQGLEQYCEKGMRQTYNALEKDGKTSTFGGYSQKIVVDENYVLKIPDSIPLDKAAPLLCAGITTYSPLKHWKIKPGSKVGVLGLGGLGHMAVKLAAAMGAEVTVLSHSSGKQADAMRMGAKKFVVTAEKGALDPYANYFDLIINTVSANLDLNTYLMLLKLDGALVEVGAPEHPASINFFPLILRRRSLAGSLIGGIQETQEMLDFCAQHGLAADIEVISIEQVNEAYERMAKSDVRYRFVIDLSTLK